MKAADLDKRRKLFLLLWRGLQIRQQRPSFKTESGLIVCQVQARSSLSASRELPGVFVEICEPELAAEGIECASFRDTGLRRVAGRLLPGRFFATLTITNIGEGFTVAGRSSSAEDAEIFEVRGSYIGARRSAIMWLRRVALSAGERRESGANRAEAVNFTAGRARIALRWLPEGERRALLGETGAGGGAGGGRGAEG